MFTYEELRMIRLALETEIMFREKYPGNIEKLEQFKKLENKVYEMIMSKEN